MLFFVDCWKYLIKLTREESRVAELGGGSWTEGDRDMRQFPATGCKIIISGSIHSTKLRSLIGESAIVKESSTESGVLYYCRYLFQSMQPILTRGPRYNNNCTIDSFSLDNKIR